MCSVSCHHRCGSYLTTVIINIKVDVQCMKNSVFFVTKQASAALQNVTCAFPTTPVYTVMSAVLVFTSPPRSVFRVSVTGTQTPRALPRFATLTLDTAYDVPTTPLGPGVISALQASLAMPRHTTAPGQVRTAAV